jgi:Putative amidoligase enzyme
MNANEITFGIEIECLIPAENCPTVGGYHQGAQIVGLPEGWNAQYDGSIRVRRGFRGAEIVSPILKGEDGIRQIKIVCEWLKTVGAKVNKSTGLHVHIGFTADLEQRKRIVTVAANFEKAIYASTGTKARERGNYCASVQRSAPHQRGELGRVTRYHVLNVQTRRPTVEFRAFAGTTNFLKIVSYVRLCVGIVERTNELTRLPNWTAKTPVETSPIKRGGEGLTALNRLFYWLGWTAGRAKAVYGAVGTDVAPAMKTCKGQLVRLARKYDESR